MEVGEGGAVGGFAGEGFGALVVEETSVDVVGAGLGDDVDDAAAGAAELGVGTAGHDLEFLDGFERDIDGSALAAGLLAEEAVVVIAAIERDVVEDAALAVDVDLVAVGALHDADAGRKREQIFELAAEHGSGLDGLVVEGRGGRIGNDVYGGGRR